MLVDSNFIICLPFFAFFFFFICCMIKVADEIILTRASGSSWSETINESLNTYWFVAHAIPQTGTYSVHLGLISHDAEIMNISSSRIIMFVPLSNVSSEILNPPVAAESWLSRLASFCWIHFGSPPSRPGPPGDGAVPWSGSFLWEGWAVGSGHSHVPPGESCTVRRAGGHHRLGTVLPAAASSHTARGGAGGTVQFLQPFLFSWLDFVFCFFGLFSNLFCVVGRITRETGWKVSSICCWRLSLVTDLLWS